MLCQHPRFCMLVCILLILVLKCNEYWFRLGAIWNAGTIQHRWDASLHSSGLQRSPHLRFLQLLQSRQICFRNSWLSSKSLVWPSCQIAVSCIFWSMGQDVRMHHSRQCFDDHDSCTLRWAPLRPAISHLSLSSSVRANVANELQGICSVSTDRRVGVHLNQFQWLVIHIQSYILILVTISTCKCPKLTPWMWACKVDVACRIHNDWYLGLLSRFKQL